MSSPFQEPSASQVPASSDAVFTPQDADHLRLLSIFHYVLGGFGFLFGCAPVFHVAFGAVMAIAPQTFENPGHPSPDPLRFIGAGLFCFGCGFMLLAWTLAGLQIYAGRCLAIYRKHTFCTVVAALNCMWFPFGTVLGVFSLIVLMRPGVKARFEQASRDPFS